MLLLEIEKQAKKLSKSDMVRLVQDVQGWLKEAEPSEPEMYPAMDVPPLEGEGVNWKLHPDFDWDDMDDAAEKLQAIKAAKTGSKHLNERTLTLVNA